MAIQLGLTVTHRQMRVAIAERDLSVAVTHRQLRLEVEYMYWKQDEIGSRIQLTITDAAEAAVDLTNANQVDLVVIKPGGTRVVWSDLDVDDPEAGQVSRELADGDLDEFGTYQGEAVINWDGTNVDRAPSRSYATWEVAAKL